MNCIDIGNKIIELGSPFLGFTVGGSNNKLLIREICVLFDSDPDNLDDLYKKISNDDCASIKLAKFQKMNKVNLENLNLSEFYNSDKISFNFKKGTKKMIGSIKSLLTLICYFFSFVLIISLYLEQSEMRVIINGIENAINNNYYDYQVNESKHIC